LPVSLQPWCEFLQRQLFRHIQIMLGANLIFRKSQLQIGYPVLKKQQSELEIKVAGKNVA